MEKISPSSNNDRHVVGSKTARVIFLVGYQYTTFVKYPTRTRTNEKGPLQPCTYLFYSYQKHSFSNITPLFVPFKFLVCSMMLKNAFDFLKPAYYVLEKSVAAKSIPAVHEIEGRRKLSDYEVPTSNVMDHSTWDTLLKKYVSTDPSNTIGDVKGVALVNYDGMGSDPNFETYLDELASTEVAKLPEPEQLAFWMNAYNALCIALLIDAMKTRKETDDGGNAEPLQSINDLSKPNLPVWDMPAGKVAGRSVSLNHIEHEQLRKVWAEPAVHGSIVCASASCPNLRPEAYVGTRVREQMDDQMRSWMKNDTKGSKLEGKTFMLSRIFLWFGDDFGGADGLRKWLPQYLDDDNLKEKFAKNKLKVRFFEYNWKMNRQT